MCIYTYIYIHIHRRIPIYTCIFIYMYVHMYTVAFPQHLSHGCDSSAWLQRLMPQLQHPVATPAATLERLPLVATARRGEPQRFRPWDRTLAHSLRRRPPGAARRVTVSACACDWVCVRACVRACVRVSDRECVCVCVCACESVRLRQSGPTNKPHRRVWRRRHEPLEHRRLEAARARRRRPHLRRSKCAWRARRCGLRCALCACASWRL
jgi:hypothetical protein